MFKNSQSHNPRQLWDFLYTNFSFCPAARILFGETEEKAGEYVEDLAASMLASTLGIKFNPDDAWDARKQAYKLSDKIVYTSNVTQSSQGNKNGLWTSVAAAVIFIPA